MSGIGSTATSYGMLDRLLGSVGSLQAQYGVLQQQTTTGKVATSYAGLGNSVGQAISLAAANGRADAYTATITAAQGKAAVQQDVLGQLHSVASTLAAQALTLSGGNAAQTVDTIATQARQALGQVAALLNTQYAGSYVFAGADSGNAPVPSAGSITSSGLYTQIGAQLSALATTPSTTAVGTVIANTVAIAKDGSAGTTVFSAYLSGAGGAAAAGTIEVADGQTVSLDVKANRMTGGSAQGNANGTGNAISDMMRSLSILANSTQAMAGNPDFAAVAKDAATTLTAAASAVAQQSGQLGLTQNTLTAAAASHASLKVVLTTQLSGITDVDPAATISKLQAVGTQLQASYNVLSIARQLNLASFLNG
jgi:flagellin-like hook-associated protein FlgL